MLLRLWRTIVLYPKCSPFASLGPGRSFRSGPCTTIFNNGTFAAHSAQNPPAGLPASNADRPANGLRYGGEWRAIPVKLDPADLIAKLLGYGIKPQRRRAHGGRTTENYDYFSNQLAGLFRLDGMEIRKIARLCELCASVVNNCSGII